MAVLLFSSPLTVDYLYVCSWFSLTNLIFLLFPSLNLFVSVEKLGDILPNYVTWSEMKSKTWHNLNFYCHKQRETI